MFWHPQPQQLRPSSCIALSPRFHAQNKPPLKILGASPPGGSVDVLARMVADVLRADFSPAVVETQSGAGGRISLNMTAIT